jgi:SHS2 domain-containing protein
MPRYQVLSHTADTGISTRADSLEAVIGNAAFAMFDLMFELPEDEPGIPVEIELEAAEPPDLLVSALSELLYRSEVGDVAYTNLAVRTDGNHLVIEAEAHPVHALELRGPPIKAVTYHDLRCEPTADGWFARVIFDV